MTPLAVLFVHPIQLSSGALWMVIPISIIVAAVYKTLRVEPLKALPWHIIQLSVMILAGMGGLMLGLWVLVRFWVD